jgi:hypothetical protein
LRRRWAAAKHRHQARRLRRAGANEFDIFAKHFDDRESILLFAEVEASRFDLTGELGS